MFFSCKELKRQARETLNGRYGLPMWAFLIMQMITAAVISPFRFSLQKNPDNLHTIIYFLALMIVSLLSGILNCGLFYIHLNMARGKETKLSDLFLFFNRRPDRLILAQFLQMLILFFALLPLCLCGLLIAWYDFPGGKFLFFIVVAATVIGECFLLLSYWFSLYFMVDHEEMKVVDAFRMSRNYMAGNKGRLFYLELSFIGMYLLCLLSFGIGFLWIIPYNFQSQTAFYRNLIKEVS